jgi:hypothetical protein
LVLRKRLEAAAGIERPLLAARPAPLDPAKILWRGQSLDLIHMVDLARDRVAGKWNRDNGDLSVEPWDQARIMLPVDVEGSYDLFVEFTRRQGDDKISVGLPVGSAQCRVSLSGWGGDARGIEQIEGQGAENNKSTRQPGTLENDRRYRLLVQVRLDSENTEARINVSLDGQAAYLEWSGPQASLSLSKLWSLPHPDRPALGGNQAAVTFHAAKMRLFEGTATLVTQTAEPSEEAASP